MCDRVAIIHRGRLQAVGTPAALIAQTGAADLEETFVRIVGEERLRADLWEQKRQRHWYQFWRRKRPEDREALQSGELWTAAAACAVEAILLASYVFSREWALMRGV